MSIAVVLLAVGFMFLAAYYLAVEQTLEQLLSRDSGSKERTRAQLRIVFALQLRGVNMVSLFGMTLYLLVARASAWQYGLSILMLCGAGGWLLRSILDLQPGSPKVLVTIASDLETRRKLYRAAGDSLRLQAVEELLTRLRSFPRYRYILR